MLYLWIAASFWISAVLHCAFSGYRLFQFRSRALTLPRGAHVVDDDDDGGDDATTSMHYSSFEYNVIFVTFFILGWQNFHDMQIYIERSCSKWMRAYQPKNPTQNGNRCALCSIRNGTWAALLFVLASFFSTWTYVYIYWWIRFQPEYWFIAFDGMESISRRGIVILPNASWSGTETICKPKLNAIGMRTHCVCAFM